LLSARGPHVVDFGIAAAADGTAVTRSGQPQGSPGWMAPEQISGHGVGPALDVFSWGLVVGYAATGRPPFGVGRPDVILYRIVHTEPDLAGLDPHLAPLIHRAVAKNPIHRPTVPELLAELPAEPPVELPAEPPVELPVELPAELPAGTTPFPTAVAARDLRRRRSPPRHSRIAPRLRRPLRRP
jgi:serine/threonine protein kinase